jgi:Ring finger domain
MTRRRLDPYTVGASRYLEREGLRPVPTAATLPRPTVAPPIRVATTMDDTALTAAILQMLMRSATETLPTQMAPVIVRPTQEQIDAGTTVLTQMTEGTTCAICQDSIQPEEIVRKMNGCQHTFHRNCIDTWFMTNVRCPVCRADIREVGAGAN